MAASPLLSRSRVLSRPFSLALKSESKKPSLLSEIPKPISNSRSHLLQSEKRISLISRLAVGSSGCLLSMLPLHSAIATARLTSVLSAELQSWGLIPQAAFRKQYGAERVEDGKYGLRVMQCLYDRHFCLVDVDKTAKF